jgi:hypothetical protein
MKSMGIEKSIEQPGAPDIGYDDHILASVSHVHEGPVKSVKHPFVCTAGAEDRRTVAV